MRNRWQAKLAECFAGGRPAAECLSEAILWEAAPAAECLEWLFTGIREQGLAVAFA